MATNASGGRKRRKRTGQSGVRVEPLPEKTTERARAQADPPPAPEPPKTTRRGKAPELPPPAKVPARDAGAAASERRAATVKDVPVKAIARSVAADSDPEFRRWLACAVLLPRSLALDRTGLDRLADHVRKSMAMAQEVLAVVRDVETKEAGP